MDLVTPAIGLIFWTTVVFVLLVLLLKKYAWKPILTAVEKRNETIKEALESAEKAKQEMESLTANNEKIITEAKKERLLSSSKLTSVLSTFSFRFIELGYLHSFVTPKILSSRPSSQSISVALGKREIILIKIY